MDDSVLVLLALMVLAVPFAVIYLLFALFGVKRRVAALEQALRNANVQAASPALAAPALPAAATAPPAEAVAAPEPATAPVVSPPATAQPPHNPWSGRREMPAPPVIPTPIRAPAQAAAPVSTRDASQDRPLVFSGDRISALARWIVQNWVYVLSALSLALAGIFLVQYGVQKGLLPPPMRVIGALALGGALIAAGEWLRRRHGDAEGPTAYLPSTFSAAGLAIAFAAILAARQMYGLIGPLPTFAGLLLTAGGALYLGWWHTPALAAMGLIGAAAAPFLTGGSAENIDWLYGYAALIAATGLGIDAYRRWAWISVLALALGYGVGNLVHLGNGGDSGLALLAAALPALAFTLPMRSLRPALAGASTTGTLWRARRGDGTRVAWPAFPVRLVAGSMLISVLVLVGQVMPGPASTMVFALLALMAAGGAIWGRRAPAISDLVLLPVLGFVWRLYSETLHFAGLANEFAAQAIALRPAETGAPATVSLLVLLAALIAAAAGWRALTGPDRPRYWAAIAASILPAAGCVIEVFWTPAPVLGPYPWALHAMAAAAMMTGLAIMLARAGQMAGAAYATLSMLILIAFAMVVVLTMSALTVALAVLLVTAAALDRRFHLPEMGWFIQAATAVLGWRLVVDPGLIWAFDEAPLWEALLAHAAPVAATWAGLRLLRDLDRPIAAMVLESAQWVFAALLADLVLWRLLDTLLPSGNELDAWRVTLIALPWLAVALGQLVRAKLGGLLRLVRLGLAVLSGGLFALLMLAAVTLTNPAAGLFGESRVFGPPVLDTLALAYALPGVLLIMSRRWLGHLPRGLHWMLLTTGAALLTLYGVLEIRSWFHGRDLDAATVTQGELYTYTMAMMLTGAVLLWQALAKRSVLLRRLAMTVIALTVAKVFLVDAAGLTGLTRVASFLALGLSLAGLAWLNRWAAGHQGEAR